MIGPWRKGLRMHQCLALIMAWVFLSQGTLCADESWQQIKGKHFVVFYQSAKEKDLAQKVLREAERYYDRIGERIGYQRVSKFWTWDERVRIVLFRDSQTFAAETGQPLWSLGYAARDSQVFHSHMIATYPQEQGFLDGLLPHEISHLILYDFIPDRRQLPVWFEEGIAQLEEADKGRRADEFMRHLIDQDQYIRLDFLMRWDIRTEHDPLKVEVFYAQSLSLVRFMLKQYGQRSFQRLCRELRDGHDFISALRKAYPGRIGNLSDLEKQWVRSFKGGGII